MTCFSHPSIFVAWMVLAGIVSPATAACRPVESPVICGSGAQSLRLISGTGSPDGRFSAGWQAVNTNGKVLGADDYGAKASVGVDPTAPDSPAKLPDDARDVLVELPQGRIVAKLGGIYWGTGDADRNHLVESLRWSPDSHWMIELAQGKWDTYASSLHRIGADGAIDLKVDFLAIARQAAATGYRKFAHKSLGGEKQIRINWGKTSRLTDAGDVELNIELVRGQDTFGDYTARFKLSKMTGKVNAKLISVTQATFP